MDTMRSLPSGTVTFLFTDIEGSTRLWEQHPEPMRLALARHDALISGTIEQQGGVVIKRQGEGDSVFAVFGRPTDAVTAAWALQRAVIAEPWPSAIPLRVRVALHTGEAELRDGDYYGLTVNRCARLRAAASGEQILLSLAIQELIRDHLPEQLSLRDLGEHRLKDLIRPERVFQLLAPDLPGDFPPLRTLDSLPNNLPQQLTSFVGREREMAEVKRLLGSTRLLTLIGAGGTGKTRLSLQAAAEVMEEYPDGAWLVELAPLSDPELVPQAVAIVLSVREEPGVSLIQTLVEHLKPRRLLLILDNCEHLLSACARLVETLLRQCPHLTILSSSREGLRMAGESLFRVPSLSLPDPRQFARGGTPIIASFAQYEAVRLFIDRATAVQPGFTVTNSNAPAVAEVCHQLDGIPLAIELAAARVRALSVEQIAARLDDRFRLLTGGSRTALPRQQTLRALIDWSYDLLSEPERVLLRRLSVFAGGWSLEGAEAVSAGEDVETWEVLDFLTGLVDKSLVLYEEPGSARPGRAGGAEGGTGELRFGGEADSSGGQAPGTPAVGVGRVPPEGRAGTRAAGGGPDPGRYRLLETVRQYALDRLAECGEGETTSRRHLDYYTGIAQQIERGLCVDEERQAWLDHCEQERANIRAALEWSQSTDAAGEAGLRLATVVGSFWSQLGHFYEGRHWLEAILARNPDAPVPLRARALWGLGDLAFAQGDHGAAERFTAQSLRLYRECGDRIGTAETLFQLGFIARYRADYTTARSLWEESLAIEEELDRKTSILWLLDWMAKLARAQGDEPRALQFDERQRALLEQLPEGKDAEVDAARLISRAKQVEAEPDPSARRLLYDQAYALFRKWSDRGEIMGALETVAGMALNAGDYSQAQSLYEASLELARTLGNRGLAYFKFVWLGRVAYCQGDWITARDLAAKGLRIAQELGDKMGTARALQDLGRVAVKQGNPDDARLHLRESLELWRQTGMKWGITETLEGFVYLEAAQARAASPASQRSGLVRTARLMGAAERLREIIGIPQFAYERPGYEQEISAVRAALGDESFAAAWSEGHAMPEDGAIEYALQGDDGR
jgi:predicted ATPase/class 3 adenylate cyclase